VSDPIGETTVPGEGSGPAPSAVERGTAIDRYVILDRLGAGAMGVVYTAFDPRLDRQVAVKLLNVRDGVAPEGLLAEARALAKLSHVNVVGVYDAGRFGDTVFITMERIEGMTFDAWLTTGHAWREVLEVLLAAGRGLSAVHEAGAVHGDFKPANVMVDAAGIAKVMDFGLAALGGTDGGRQTPRGTPLYMAPEQHMGEPASFASDQYAFCVAAHEALAGEHPRKGAHSVGMLLEAISREAPPLNCPGLPQSVRNAITRGLSPSPQARWPSMDALLEVLSDALEPRRSRWVGGAALLGLVGVLGVAAVSSERPGCPSPDVAAAALVPPAARAEASDVLSTYDEAYGVRRAGLILEGIDDYASRWARADADACAARLADPSARASHEASATCLERHRNDFVAAFSVLRDAAGVERVRAADLLSGLPDPLRCVDEDVAERGVAPPPPQHAARVGDLRARLASLRAENAVGRWTAVRDAVGPLLEQAHTADYPPVVAEALWVQGETFRRLHDIPAAERSLSEAAWMAMEHDDRRLALDAAVSLVALRREISQTERNRQWARRARRLVRVDSDPSVEGMLELHLSVAERNVGAWAEAKAHADAAVAAMLRVFGDEHPKYAKARHVLGAALFRMNDQDAALELALENLALRERILGPRHPEIVDSLLLIGVVHAARGEAAPAEAVYRRAAEIQEAVVGPRSRVLAGVYNNLVSALTRQGKLKEAREMAEAAVSIWRDLGQNDSLVYGLVSSGGVAFQLEDYDAMLEHYTKARALVEGSGAEHPLWPSIVVWTAGAHVCLGELAEARRWLDQLEGNGGSLAVDRVFNIWQAVVFAGEGEDTEARLHAREALASEEPIELPERWWSRLREIAASDG
jgi:tetratricopeptide (TPR) repeat protein